jgi:hypothetical protein
MKVYLLFRLTPPPALKGALLAHKWAYEQPKLPLGRGARLGKN